MAFHETEDNKVFQRFKKKTAAEPHQVKKKKEKWKRLNWAQSVFVAISWCLFCSGGPLQSRGLSLVGLFSTHPFRSWYPTMHLWRPEDFWVSGSYCLFNVSDFLKIYLDLYSFISILLFPLFYSPQSWTLTCSCVFIKLYHLVLSHGNVQKCQICVYLVGTNTCNDHNCVS